ncbi:MAG: TolC family protein [Magnetococcales bacterium]|nr:TolC family protein [Magnetococcales bacterium]MBF0150066.1 TolC family protein [Magnetococcales bacterium]
MVTPRQGILLQSGELKYRHRHTGCVLGLCVAIIVSGQGYCQDPDTAPPDGNRPDSVAMAAETQFSSAKDDQIILEWMESGEQQFERLLHRAVSEPFAGARKFLFGKKIVPVSIREIEKRVLEHNLVLAMQPHQVEIAKLNVLATEAALMPEWSATVQYDLSKSHHRSAMIGRFRETPKTWETVTEQDVGTAYYTEDGEKLTVESGHVGKTWFELGVNSESCVMVDGEAVGDTCNNDVIYDTLEESASVDSENWSKIWAGSLDMNVPLSWGGRVNVAFKTTYVPYDAPVSVSLKPLGIPLETALEVGEREWSSQLSLGINSALPFTKNFGAHGFGSVVQVEKTTLDYNKSRSSRRMQENMLLRDTMESYWFLVRNLLMVLSAIEHRSLLEQRLVRVDRLYQAQRATEYDRLQTEADVEDARNREEIAWNEWLIRANELAELLNLSSEQIILPQGFREEFARERTPDDREVLQVAMERRADLHAARIDVQKADVEKNYRIQQLLPDVSLVAAYNILGKGTRALFGYDDFGSSVEALATPDERSYIVGLVYSYPLEQRAEKARHANASSAQTQAMDRLRQVELQVADDVTTALADSRGSQSRIGLARMELELAEMALEGAKRMRAMERVPEFEVLQRQRLLFDARLNLIQALIDRRQSWVNLNYAQGMWGSGQLDFKDDPGHVRESMP